MLEGSCQDVKGSVLEVEFRHHAVEEKFPRFADPHGVHAEVDVPHGIRVGVGCDEGVDEPLALEVPRNVMRSGRGWREDRSHGSERNHHGGSGCYLI